MEGPGSTRRQAPSSPGGQGRERPAWWWRRGKWLCGCPSNGQPGPARPGLWVGSAHGQPRQSPSCTELREKLQEAARPRGHPRGAVVDRWLFCEDWIRPRVFLRRRELQGSPGRAWPANAQWP